MDANTKIEMIRELAQSKIMELQPFAGEEMNLLQTDPHRSGFVAGERALAEQILAVIAWAKDGTAEPVEEEMVMSLGQT
jgi:hypothetical protein